MPRADERVSVLIPATWRWVAVSDRTILAFIVFFSYAFLQDSDDRAVGYVAGSSPNRWGLSRDGSSVSDLFSEGSGKQQQQHRAHSLFAPVVLLMLKEV